MEGDGEAVRLVADPLEEVEGLGPPRDADRLGVPGPVDFLELLGQCGQLDLTGQPESFHHLLPDGQLALAPIDQEKLRWVGEAAAGPPHADVLDRFGVNGHLGPVTPGGFGPGRPIFDKGPKAPGEDLFHRGVVVVPGDRRYFESPVVGLLGQGVLEDHHRADVVGTREVAHVVTLDSQRRLSQRERCLEFGQRPGPAVVVRGPAQAVSGQVLRGVLRDHLLQGPFRAAPGHGEIDWPPAYAR